jgi:hypothetical protein
MQKAIILCLMIFLAVASLTAQSNSRKNIPRASEYNCEDFNARVDAVRSVAKNSGKKIFVIFHAGKTESEVINARRLAYVRDFLESDSKLWKELDVIYARGDRSSDEAVIAFYVAGNLFEVTTVPRNRTPCMDCCEANYYTPQSLLKPIDFNAVKAREFRRNRFVP